MSKITFRADDDLVDRLEACDASKSEVMREALRAHLDEVSAESVRAPEATLEATIDDTLDALVRERVDAMLEQRLDARGAGQTRRPQPPQDINVNVTVEGERAAPRSEDETHAADATGDQNASVGASDTDQGRKQCSGCGTGLDESAVYCSNCGEKATHRVFCDCGDELRSDWAFCPGCGRRTPAADVLERS
ncbi:zinc ribbon domain-containing protein [Halomarina salina]|uniref:Zinc ribbon domain-containing protein n=1 Tax=Halomarina salina TaxID=1872699 RepID=A0ABD5RKW5_9EURY|nr:zinc ribbon domain-containing protein [Halomarina salina]